MSNRLHDALLGMTDPARKLADALEEYRTGKAQYMKDIHGDSFEIEPERIVVQEFARAAGKTEYMYRVREEVLNNFGFTFDGNEWWIGDHGTDIAMRISPKTLRSMNPFEWAAWTQAMYPSAVAWAKGKNKRSTPPIPEPHAHLLTGIPSEILDRYKDMESEDQFRKRVDMARPMTTKVLDKMTMEVIAHQADELLHAIDLARLNVQGAIPLQTLDLVRGKVKDVLANLAGTIEKDM